MARLLIKFVFAAVLCFVLSTAARAELTGNYTWVAYDNLTGFIGEVASGEIDSTYLAPGNITNYTWDGDRPGETQSGNLVRYADGGDTGVTMAIEFGGQGQLFIEQGFENLTPAASEFDVLSPHYKGKLVLHSNAQTPFDRTQTLTFTGLDSTKTYDFLGIAEGNSSYYDSFSQVDLLSTDAQTNESILTANASINGIAGFGVNSPTQSFLGYDDDDLIKFTGISPGEDGTISVVVTGGFHGNRGHAPAFDAIALAEVNDGGPVCSQGDADCDGDVDLDDLMYAAGYYTGSCTPTVDCLGDPGNAESIFNRDRTLGDVNDGFAVVGSLPLVGDGDVDLDDINDMINAFTGPLDLEASSLVSNSLMTSNAAMSEGPLGGLQTFNLSLDPAGAAVPEPATISLLSIGLLTLTLIGYQRRRRSD